MGREAARGREPGSPDRRQVLLLVEQQPSLVHVPVEVDGELRDAGDRLAAQHELDAAVGMSDLSRHAEVAIEPGVQQDAAVHLDRELLPPVAARVRVRLDPETGRVGVGADDAERCGRIGAAGRQPPGDDRAATHDETAFLVGPGGALVELDEPGGGQSSNRRCDGVEGRRRRVEKGAKVGGGIGTVSVRGRRVLHVD